MSAQKRIKLVSSQSKVSHAEALAIQESKTCMEMENSAVLAAQVRARAEAQARAIAEGKLRHENELLVLIEERKSSDLKLVDKLNTRTNQEKALLAINLEKLNLENNLSLALEKRISTEKQAIAEINARIIEEKKSSESFEKTTLLEREAASIAREKLKQNEQISAALNEKNKNDKIALSLLEAKSIAEMSRTEGTNKLIEERKKSILLTQQLEKEEQELFQLESSAKRLIEEKIENVNRLKLAAQQRVEEEMLAAQGIQFQLKAEEEAIAKAKKHAEISEKAIQAAALCTAQEQKLTQRAEQELKNNEIATHEFDQKLILINERIQIAEKLAKLRISERMHEDKKLQEESKVANVIKERIATEKSAIHALNKKLSLESDLRQVAALQIKIENDAIAAISLRMETEQKSIDTDNIRITQETTKTEILAAQIKVDEEIILEEKKKEQISMIALRSSKFRAKAEAKAAQAESELHQAHKYATQLAQSRFDTAQNLQQFIDERIQDEQFYLELERRKCEVEMLERNLAKDRREAKQRYLTEIESRIAAEKQAALVTSQRQIAEQLLRQTALDKWKMEKDVIQSLKPFESNMSLQYQANNPVIQSGVN